MTPQKATGTSAEMPAVTTNNNYDSSDAVMNVKEFTAPLPNFPIAYSRGKNTFDNAPEQRVAQSWCEFWDAIDKDRGSAKGQQYICGPMKLGDHPEKDKYPHESHYRLAVLADDSMVIPLDCDGMPAESFNPLLSLLGVFEGCSYTTSSHTDQNPHIRAFVALSRGVNRNERTRVGKAFEWYIAAQGVVGVKFDASVYKTEQQCYLPLKGAAFYNHNGGVALDVDALLTCECPDEQPVSVEGTGIHLFPDLVGANHAFNEDVKEGGRSDAVIKYIGYMRKRRIPEDLLPKVAMDYNIARCKPPLDEAEVCDLVNRYKHQGALAGGDAETSTKTEWPELKPLPPKNPPTPVLDTDLLPSTIQAYVKDCAERLQVPPEMIATPLLISFGNVIGKKAAVYPKRNDFSWYEYPNLWGCCVAPPATLKSPTLTAGLRFMREIEADMRAIHETKLRAWKLNEKLRKASSKNTEKAAVAAKESGDEAEAFRLLAQLDDLEPPVCGRLTTSDATPEARLELLRQNPNGLMQVVDELDGHFQRLNRDGFESARAQELTFYDGKDDYAEDRVKRGSSFVESPRVAMYGNLQPAKVEGYMRALNTGGRDDGYLQRLFQLVVWPTLSPDFQPTNNPEDLAAQEAVRTVFNAVHSMQLERDPINQRIKPKALRFTPDAQDEFDKIYVARERENRKNLEANPVLAAHRGKMVGTLIKLSLICAFLENPRAQHIDREALETALRLVNFYYTHAKRAYMAATRGGVLAAHALLAKIKAGKVPNPFSARDDIYEKKWAGLNTAETHEAISILIEHGYLYTEEVLTSGRPRRVYFINPLCTGV